jgi:zinc/manganese transport system substrate-binding protein
LFPELGTITDSSVAEAGVKARLGLVFAACVLIAASSACSSDGSSIGRRMLSVVASTNVYGDVAARVGGSAVAVTSLISDPAADPHSYEANPQNLLALSQADVIVENGGGYDDFVDTMLSSANNAAAATINVVELSGKAAAAGGELNEHVWYDFPTMGRFADALASALSSRDPEDAATFAANATAFKNDLAALTRREAALAAVHSGAGVAVTEPVPLYLLEAAGLTNLTPPEFSEAIEEGTDVPVSALQATLALFTSHQVALLAYNEQTAGPETEQVKAAAVANNIPVVPVTETLPTGEDYIGWMSDNLSAIQTALR